MVRSNKQRKKKRSRSRHNKAAYVVCLLKKEFPELVDFFFATMICHYENLPMQYTRIFTAAKINYNIFKIFARNIDCGYMLELPEGLYHYTLVLLYKVGYKGVLMTQICFCGIEKP